MSETRLLTPPMTRCISSAMEIRAGTSFGAFAPDRAICAGDRHSACRNPSTARASSSLFGRRPIISGCSFLVSLPRRKTFWNADAMPVRPWAGPRRHLSRAESTPSIRSPILRWASTPPRSFSEAEITTSTDPYGPIADGRAATRSHRGRSGTATVRSTFRAHMATAAFPVTHRSVAFPIPSIPRRPFLSLCRSKVR